MRIALIVERFQPGSGGVENVAWTVAHELARSGEEVHVFARCAAESALARVHHVRVPAQWQPLRVLTFSRRVAAALRRESFDVVHSFSRTLTQDIYRAGGGCHAAYLARRHSPRAARFRRATPRHAVLLWIEGRVFRDPKQWIQCNSHMVRRELARNYAVPDARLVVLYNGVDLERFHPRRRESDGARLRREIGARESPVWLFAGSGFQRKGLDTALAALACAAPRDAELWVVGRDAVPAWRALAARCGVAERVRFLGPRSDIEAVYAAADALLLPTRYDAFANVCLEAAAAGLPVITSRNNGAAEVIDASGCVIDDPEDVAAFAKALESVADPSTRRVFAEAARQRAETLSWQSHVAGLRELYRRVRR